MDSVLDCLLMYFLKSCELGRPITGLSAAAIENCSFFTQSLNQSQFRDREPID